MLARTSNQARTIAVCLIAIGATTGLLGACSQEDSAQSPSSSTAATTTTEEPTPGPVVVEPISDETKAWWSYSRPATFEVSTEEVDVPMRDGVDLGCVLSRPADGGDLAPGEHPGLVAEFTPYVGLAEVFQGEADFFVRRGYNVIICTVRGSGRSGGTWDHANFERDAEDGHDLVEWLATQPFSDGRVGQFGESYGGATSYLSASEAPEHLRAIAPLQSPNSLYRDVVYPGGIKSTEGGTIDNWPVIAEEITEGVVSPDGEFPANRAHPTFDGYWLDRSMDGRLENIEVPVLALGGWVDSFFRSGTLANIEAIPDRTWMIYGPWPHGYFIDLTDSGTEGTAPLPEGADRLPSGVLLAWFDHWVMERPDVPVPAEPTTVAYEGPVGSGAGWRQLDRWDPSTDEGATYFLGTDDTLTHTAPTAGTQTLEQSASGDSADVTFTSSPLVTDHVLLGHPELTVSATLDGTEAHFYVELIDVAPDGTETLVNDGFLAASHRESHTDPTPVTPGETVDYQISIRPAFHRFAAGHRLRIRIGGGDQTALEPVKKPVAITIELGADSFVHMPGFTPTES